MHQFPTTWSKLVGELGGLETLTTVTTGNNLVSKFADVYVVASMGMRT